MMLKSEVSLYRTKNDYRFYIFEFIFFSLRSWNEKSSIPIQFSWRFNQKYELFIFSGQIFAVFFLIYWFNQLKPLGLGFTDEDFELLDNFFFNGDDGSEEKRDAKQQRSDIYSYFM